MYNMKKTTFLVIALSIMGVMDAVSQQTLFDSPFVSDYDNKNMPYRIPAIVRTVTETSNNDILVFADKRHGGGDVGQYKSNSSAINAHIDLTFRRSSDNGSTWDTEQTIIRGSETMGYGDIAVVSNWENPKEIVFFVAAGNVFFTSSSSSDRLRCFRFRSTDGGESWTNEEITDALYSKVNYNGAFFSSGRICQSTQIKVGEYYRIYAALCVTGTNSIVLYSDDFGETWDVLAGDVTVPISGGNEAKCEELPNGNVVVSSRAEGDRYFNVFTYTDKIEAKGDWAMSYTSGSLGVASKNKNSTNGEILILPAKDASGNKCKIVLQSMPYGKSSSFLSNSTRSHVSIYWKVLSTDDVTSASVFSGDWNRYQVSSTTSAYSSMIIQKDGNIGFVYEENEQSYGTGGYDIMYQSLSLATITSNNYSIDSSVGVPTFTNESGNYENSVTVEITSTTDGANIYYTLDGTEPTTKSTAYTGPFSLAETTTVKAIAVNEECFFSSVSETEYTIVKKEISVNPEVSLTAANSTLTVGETTQLTFTTNSGGAVTYTSNNPAVATVDGNGVVTAVAAGTATITASVAATSQYNAASASCEITVNAADGGGDDGSGEGGDDSGDDTGNAKTYELKLLNGKIGAATFHLVTFSATEAVKVPNGVKAYYVKATDSENVKLTRVSGSVIPAKTGVILMGTGDSIRLTVTTEAGTALNGNLLMGTLDEVNPELNSTDYILAVKGSGDLKGQFAFCQIPENMGNSYPVDDYANRAYLSLGATFATRSITLSFDGEEGGATAIDEVEAVVDTPAEYYTLQGVRVEGDKLTPGIYIMKHHGKTRKVRF